MKRHLGLLICFLGLTGGPPGPLEFSRPEPVTIRGYGSDAMEPFITRDGKYLFFNNSNDPKVDTNLHWAERVSDVVFQYRGEIAGVNTEALEGVPSMDRNGVFYFVSNRSYGQTASTLYRGKFSNGDLSSIELVPGVSLAKPGIVNFDAEIAADGNTLYFVESQFGFSGRPLSAKILIARRSADRFARWSESEKIMERVNTAALNYAPATSADELELFFTRLDPDGPRLYMASRADTSRPFSEPARIAAATGFVEAPSLSPDGKSLYYHKKDNGRFVIYRVTRP